MMPRATLSLILLISAAHALVHVYELSLPSLEQQIASEFFGEDWASGKAFSGRLSNAWRLMWGFGAIAAGVLVDRFGARPLLAIYLLGCTAACAVAAGSTDKASLFAAMLVMGLLASIYHPAGLSLISLETNAVNRPRALGIHGIFGSAGISMTPLIAGVLLTLSLTWRQVYAVLAVPGLLLGGVFILQSFQQHGALVSRNSNRLDEQDHVDWTSFLVLTVVAAVQGFVYSALMTFLPRYLGRVELPGLPEMTQGNFIAAGVLLAGCLGQELAGRFARPALLERQLACISLANVPFLSWMAVAVSWDRVAAAGFVALVHFMHQPIYNSLIAKYTPRHRRSLSYGFSFAMGLGLGSFGARFAGAFQSDTFVYGTLAAAAGLAGLLCLPLWLLNRPTQPSPRLEAQPVADGP